MERIKVSSSNVASVGYEADGSILEVEFSDGDVYQYYAVPERHFAALTSGIGSVGRYLNREVKPFYRYRRVR